MKKLTSSLYPRFPVKLRDFEIKTPGMKEVGSQLFLFYEIREDRTCKLPSCAIIVLLQRSHVVIINPETIKEISGFELNP